MPFHPHMPEPLHGWREFVGEVGIIVIGVLIALGAEQVVEVGASDLLRVCKAQARSAQDLIVSGTRFRLGQVEMPSPKPLV